MLLAPLLLAAAPPANPPTSRLEVSVTNLRSARGQVRLCLTREPRFFPDCKSDPAARSLSVAAGKAAQLELEGLPPGTYALAVFHDENGNAKLDTFARIPREGFGFSRNPAIRFGPPKFADARFTLPDGTSGRQTVRLRYFL